MATISHPLLGEITGVSVSESVLQFRGIKFANLSSRFAASVLNDNISNDATKFGPTSPQAPNAMELTLSLIQKSLPFDHVASQSDLECLTLNVSVPRGASVDSKLPVFVWVYGGGYLTGANSWPPYDLGKIVALSAEIGKPVIGVSIAYRTGIFGFLDSTEFISAGFGQNRGLNDQKVAFRWVKKYISGFGGDPENITAIGQSAGGVSVTLHLRSEEPLFKNIIAMGGQASLLRPHPIPVHDDTYKLVSSIFDLQGLSSQQRVSRLESIPFEEIVEKIPPKMFSPSVDGVWFKEPITIRGILDPQDKNTPGKLSWAGNLMIGDCAADGHILGLALLGKTGLSSAFIQYLREQWPESPGLVKSLLSEYVIIEGMGDAEALDAIVQVLNDAAFYAPAILTAKGWPRDKKSFVYHFNSINEWDGPLKGKANHILDVAYLFLNYNDELSKSEAQVARDFAGVVVRFVNGEEPWEEFDEEKRNVKIFGGVGNGEIRNGDEDQGRRKLIWKYIDNLGGDRVIPVIQGFLLQP